MALVRLAWCAIFLGMVPGCGTSGPSVPEGVPVGGTIAFANGLPVSGGTLVLRPVGAIHGAMAEIKANGAFELVDPRGNKAVVPGRYQVYVLLNPGRHQNLVAMIPQRYQSTENGDSDVEIEIRAAVRDLRIRLKG